MSLGRNCPSCGSSAAVSLGEIEKTMEHSFGSEPFSLSECRSCDMIYLGQNLSSDDFMHMYEDSLQFNGSVYREEETVKAAKAYYGACYAELLGEMGIAPEHVRVLEAGAGRAWMCMVAHEIGKALTVAQDVSPECAAECPWVDEYVVGEITDSRVARRAPYHVISVTHVIEHVPSPVDFMRVLKANLHEQGRLFITAPHRPLNWSGVGSIETWREWSYNHVPAHLQYFSENAMSVAAQGAGLKVARWRLHEEGQSFEAVLKHN